ncbi:uncharacterized protein LOC118736471, partial [Rhagoletis pomonella]|uniref:uncharacterized protein LOC118736471 n=1 Tax=Rhagoletis pomonella TaxID=28610 RepID=UPI00178186F2
MQVQERINFVRENNFCKNCLAFSHTSKECGSSFTCVYCQKPHHSMLHINSTQNPYSNSNPNAKTHRAAVHATTAKPSDESTSSQQGSAHTTQATQQEQEAIQAHHSSSREKTLLPTAMVPIIHLGEIYKLSALIDPGSEKTFISSKIKNLLKLPTKRAHYEISGMGGRIVQNSNQVCLVTLCSTDTKIKIETNAIVLPQLTQFLPAFSIKNVDLTQFASLDLADPTCFTQGKIDLVIGSDLTPKIFVPGLQNFCDSLLGQNTIFGWILSG